MTKLRTTTARRRQGDEGTMPLTPENQAFLALTIINLYDEEVGRHPEGIKSEDAKAAIRPQILTLVERMHADQDAWAADNATELFWSLESEDE